jgi:glycosyltransferase involved in cell wall biosynthesis
MAMALRATGYEARTYVYDVYSIHRPDDYDWVARDFFRGDGWLGPIRRLLLTAAGEYLVLAWLLMRFDIFHFYFDGGFLARTRLASFEVGLLHLAGKKVVLMPYGSDVAVPSQMRSPEWRQGLMTHYPETGRREAQTKRRIAHYSERADFIVACLVHFETLPRWDLLTTLHYPIDATAWQPTGKYSDADGKTGPVVVVHAPNHRALKGTVYLVEACRELEAEGYQVQLRLLERVPNSEVHRAMAEADIVADQFILGFAMTALEGMSLGRPVLSNLSEPGYYEAFRRLTGLDRCPIVDSPPASIKENLRRLIESPRLRREIGEAGRRYVEENHSFEPVARMWEMVYRRIWFGEPLETAAWDPLRSPDRA